MATLSPPSKSGSPSSSLSMSATTSSGPHLVAPAPRRPIALVNKQHRSHRHLRHHSQHQHPHTQRIHHHWSSASLSLDGGGTARGEAPLAEQLSRLSVTATTTTEQPHQLGQHPGRVQSAGDAYYHYGLTERGALGAEDPVTQQQHHHHHHHQQQQHHLFDAHLDPDLTPTKARLQSMRQAIGNDGGLLSPPATHSADGLSISPLAHKSPATIQAALPWLGARNMEMQMDEDEEQQRQQQVEEDEQNQLQGYPQQQDHTATAAPYFPFPHDDHTDTTTTLMQDDYRPLNANIPYNYPSFHPAELQANADADTDADADPDAATTPPATPSPAKSASMNLSRSEDHRDAHFGGSGPRLPSSPISRLHTRNPFGRAASYEG
ncbi:hypothetical protein BDZ90DRAFT_260100 [Jaminaea rosea]|uniref:Uncharacterized protein n=1 Tax=Jaminaea rosea TaxID=1569628 RepID=A0A316UTD4_9BASI|nr:hypothetical protein BDZ90DRAFT_260100 [Jaminaea rosea]PWN27611.1 hypothetical protein BDZ90DRAFT_260100 [Jaminaea rosea]